MPGLGAVAVEKLAAKGVNSTVKLMGEFLLQDRNRKKFSELLQNSGELRQQDLDKYETDAVMFAKSQQFAC